MMARGADALRNFINQEIDASPQTTELPARSSALPPFPVSALPESCARFVTALSEAQQAPLDMVVGFLLGVVASAVEGRVEIRPNMRQPGYAEAAQLFLLVQGESSERKSSTLKVLEQPLTVTFTRAAEQGYFRFAESIEPRLIGDLGGDMQPWGGKLVGNTVRLAGLLALMDRQVTVY